MIASTESGEGSASSAAVGSGPVSGAVWWREESSSMAPPASRNGSLGMPGIRQRPSAPNPAIRIGCL